MWVGLVSVLILPEVEIGSPTRQELLVRSLLRHLATVHHDDVVRVHDSGQSVCHDEHGSVHRQARECILHRALGGRVQGRGGLVQNHDRGILELSPYRQ
jgi:hypothetical protein